MSNEITFDEIVQGDAIWCAGSAERERMCLRAKDASGVLCRQGEMLEFEEGRILDWEQARTLLAERGTQRLVVTAAAGGCPEPLRQAGFAVVYLRDCGCDADDFMDPEDAELVAQRLRELGYL